MGTKAAEATEIERDDFTLYLRAKHAVYMEVDGVTYYITDANDRYWRLQDTTQFNDKGHYVDCSELMPTIAEFLAFPCIGEETIMDVYDRATFYASEHNDD